MLAFLYLLIFDFEYYVFLFIKVDYDLQAKERRLQKSNLSVTPNPVCFENVGYNRIYIDLYPGVLVEFPPPRFLTQVAKQPDSISMLQRLLTENIVVATV